MPDHIPITGPVRGPCGRDPSTLTATERLVEVAEILAAGMLRLRQKARGISAPTEDVSLDLGPDQSVHRLRNGDVGVGHAR